MNSFLLFLFLHLLINVKKFYKCVGRIDEYKTNVHFFIPGKIYKYISETAGGYFLIDELGDDHYIPIYIFEEHFKALKSNKRHRNDKERSKI